MNTTLTLISLQLIYNMVTPMRLTTYNGTPHKSFFHAKRWSLLFTVWFFSSCNRMRCRGWWSNWPISCLTWRCTTKSHCDERSRGIANKYSVHNKSVQQRTMLIQIYIAWNIPSLKLLMFLLSAIMQSIFKLMVCRKIQQIMSTKNNNNIWALQ